MKTRLFSPCRICILLWLLPATAIPQHLTNRLQLDLSGVVETERFAVSLDLKPSDDVPAIVVQRCERDNLSEAACMGILDEVGVSVIPCSRIYGVATEVMPYFGASPGGRQVLGVPGQLKRIAGIHAVLRGVQPSLPHEGLIRHLRRACRGAGRIGANCTS